jgi:hypothetical protein
MSDVRISLATGSPSRWVVTLSNGAAIDVWADGYREDTDTYLFEVLADVDGTLDDAVLILSTSATDSRRLALAVARFPKSAVAEIRTVS